VVISKKAEFLVRSWGYFQKSRVPGQKLGLFPKKPSSWSEAGVISKRAEFLAKSWSYFEKSRVPGKRSDVQLVRWSTAG
jgi:hypothetical protein